MRKTSYVMESSSPFWNQTFVYPNITLMQLKTRHLEITAWSHNRNSPNEFLGEFVLDLSGKAGGGGAHWAKMSLNIPRRLLKVKFHYFQNQKI